jgi:hypothetical protein
MATIALAFLDCIYAVLAHIRVVASPVCRVAIAPVSCCVIVATEQIHALASATVRRT